MKIRIFASIAAAAVLLCSCVPSVRPFYTDQDVVWDARLLGSWLPDGKTDSEIWTFEKSGEKSYKLTLLDRGKKGEFDARLFRLKDEYFLDLIPTKCDYAPDQADLVGVSMIPGHLLMRVPELGAGLKLAFFDSDWLEKFLTKNPATIEHYREGERILLTAETHELQRFVLEHLQDGLFAKPGELVRSTNNVSAPPPH